MPYNRDDNRYMAYYMNQAGGDMPGFIGASTQYGNGLGGMFRSLFRFAMPLLRRGFSMAKPHLKTAATNIIGDVVSNIAKSILSARQEGHGMIVRTIRALKKPPSGSGRHQTGAKKRRKTGGKNARVVKKKTGAGRERPLRKRSRISLKDIF